MFTRLKLQDQSTSFETQKKKQVLQKEEAQKSKKLQKNYKNK